MSLIKNLSNKTSLLTLSVLATCSSPSSIIGPDGTPHYIVRCGFIERCYKESRELCQGNYKIINTTTNTDVFNGLGTVTQDLLIKCEENQTSDKGDQK